MLQKYFGAENGATVSIVKVNNGKFVPTKYVKFQQEEAMSTGTAYPRLVWQFYGLIGM